VIPEVEGGSHKHLKSVSRKAALVYREKHGRFIIAEEVFKPGDVIAVEKAFVSILLPHNYHRQCFQCYNPYVNFHSSNEIFRQDIYNMLPAVSQTFYCMKFYV